MYSLKRRKDKMNKAYNSRFCTEDLFLESDKIDIEGVIIDHHQIPCESGYPEDYCVYILENDHIFPRNIKLDSIIFPYFASYMTNVLMAKNLKANKAITKITLRKYMGLQNKSSLPIEFTLVRALDEEETKEMERLSGAWKAFTRRENFQKV